jgi:hypothetical protein
MLKLAALIALVVLALAALLGLWVSARDRAQMRAAWATIEGMRDPAPPVYDPAMVADLPEVARRYFARAIQPGTPLHRIVGLQMQGSFVLNGTPLPMTARQVLAPPGRGFVWQAQVGTGLMRFAGSDGYLAARDGTDSWTKFWLRGLIPLARIGGTADHARAALTRVMLESVWAPASLLPQFGASWVQTGPDSAEIRFDALPETPPMQVTLDAQGNLIQVWALRWTDANPERTYRLQPFGGRMLRMGNFDGFAVPVEVELGNLFGTPDYAPFFLATVTSVRF